VTEKDLWLTPLGLGAVLQSGYKYYVYGRDFGGTLVLVTVSSEHAVVAESTAKQNGEIKEYTIVSTREKNGASGIYGKTINAVYRQNDKVCLSTMGGVTEGFWKEK
jgi:hypothetical protein